MTVIAWDGRTLAADSQGTIGNELIIQVRKIHVLGATALAFAGLHEEGLVLKRWYENGAHSEQYPPFQTHDDRGPTTLIVADQQGVAMYREQPVPIPVEVPFWAWGSGSMLAIGALAQGADAIQAVKVACQFSPYCELPVQYHKVRP